MPTLPSSNPATAANLIDGKTWTRWETAWSTPDEATVELTLAAERRVTCARWQTGPREYARAFRIDALVDGVWQTVANDLSAGTISSQWQEAPIDRRTTRLRWVFSNPAPKVGKVGSFSEILLYGTP